MTTPIHLSDAQITTVMQLARPLQPDQRVAFLEMLVAKLNGCRELGDGQLYQICRHDDGIGFGASRRLSDLHAQWRVSLGQHLWPRRIRIYGPQCCSSAQSRNSAGTPPSVLRLSQPVVPD